MKMKMRLMLDDVKTSSDEEVVTCRLIVAP